ncbi:MAG: hypothetical protein M3492_14065 [Actinomycetota bacterium]|nr:hypothetical protein [Actinomycetota bacterium]
MSRDHLRAPMTGLRIIDNSGASWPITGHRCLICKMPRDPAVDDSIHPGCRPAQPLTDAAYGRLVVNVTRSLGAAGVAPPTEGEIAQ